METEEHSSNPGENVIKKQESGDVYVKRKSKSPNVPLSAVKSVIKEWE